MKYNRDIHHRRSVRLRGYDYSRDGFYFITICSYGRAMLFGDIIKGKMVCNELGEMIVEEWVRSSALRKEIMIDQFIVMPNHFHGIVRIRGRGDRLVAPNNEFAIVPNHRFIGIQGRGDRPVAPTFDLSVVAPTWDHPGPRPRSLSSFIAGFKSVATLRGNRMRQSSGTPLWQRNYYEHIIRNKGELEQTREYIKDNALNWDADENNLTSIDKLPRP